MSLQTLARRVLDAMPEINIQHQVNEEKYSTNAKKQFYSNYSKVFELQKYTYP